jgi:hypothetical protein
MASACRSAGSKLRYADFMPVGPRLATRTLVRSCTLALAAVVGSVLGCPLELQRGLSCGDGWWDPEYEECDPRAVDAPYIDACRDRGIPVDAECDPQTCTIRASEEDCQCRLDPSACEQVCGDGIVSGDEECEPELGIRGGYQADPLECSDYISTGSIQGKHYASGNVGPCNDDCTFSHIGCNFCGDGVQDGEFTNWIAPGVTATFAAEICDGNDADPEQLDVECEDRCIDDDDPPINGDVVLQCDFECEPDCSDFAPPSDVAVPGLGCCIAKGSPCPGLGTMGVPDLPCCSWLGPEGLPEGTCPELMTGSDFEICP